MPSGLDQKLKLDEILQDITGKKTCKRKELLKLLYDGPNGINKLDLKGVQGDTVKYKGKTYKGGQVIHCGDDEVWQEFCGGKKKIAGMQLLSFAKNHYEVA